MTPLLAQALDDFMETPTGWCVDDPDQAAGLCGVASWEFAQLLAERGIEGRMVQMHGIAGQDAPLYPWTEPGEPLGHTVVQAEGYTVDWTLRQYDPDTDCPALIEPWPNSRVLDPSQVKDGGRLIALTAGGGHDGR
jgi:hypothetical protein